MTCRALWLCTLALPLAACEEKPQPSTTAASEPEAPRTEAVATNATPAASKGLSCGYFMSDTEAKAIGLEGFDATKEEPRSDRGVHCAAAGLSSLTIFRGSDLGSMKRGTERAQGVEQVEGPPLARDTYWYKSSGLFGVFFLSENGNYAGHMVGKDQVAVAKLAAKVAPHLNKQ